jgi:hypothetical protein
MFVFTGHQLNDNCCMLNVNKIRPAVQGQGMRTSVHTGGISESTPSYLGGPKHVNPSKFRDRFFQDQNIF